MVGKPHVHRDDNGYRRKAADCLYLTQRLADEQSRRLLLEMARAWVELAVRAERNATTGIVYEPTPLKPLRRND
jgi:hypothetical protein